MGTFCNICRRRRKKENKDEMDCCIIPEDEYIKQNQKSWARLT